MSILVTDKSGSSDYRIYDITLLHAGSSQIEITLVPEEQSADYVFSIQEFLAHQVNSVNLYENTTESLPYLTLRRFEDPGRKPEYQIRTFFTRTMVSERVAVNLCQTLILLCGYGVTEDMTTHLTASKRQAKVLKIVEGFGFREKWCKRLGCSIGQFESLVSHAETDLEAFLNDVLRIQQRATETGLL